ncbi:hypothetical protein [Paenibacillus montanisoli]|uniref:Uncharacterized protein n=1 Tax=Paenibacillus montanisoli TaxID=2081970 RepID=A0A328U5S5_9BACL|nr:hypothetical protein [Paenibacillus montanisoli]RAP77173.1 hypothetical protein DL346_01345 [Paenibacillus montanisoli]
METLHGKRTALAYRLTAAVLIAVTLLAATGCGSAANDNAAAESSAAAPPSITTRIKAGGNPFEVAGIQNPQKFLEVFAKVQTAIAADDKATVASLILYPLRVNGKSGTQLIKTRDVFVEQYDSIINSNVKEAIARQSADNLFVNYQGVMVGNGDIWFGGSADTPQVYGIIAVNHDI